MKKIQVNRLKYRLSRIFMSIDLIIWYIRILYLFAAYEILGPKLTMIYEMVSVFDAEGY